MSEKPPGYASVFEQPEPVKTSKLRDYSLKEQVNSSKIILNGMSLDELLALRSEIDTLLPTVSLKDFNAQEEVLLQYHRIKALQAEVAVDQDTPTNQKAQVANTVARLLSDIIGMRNELYNTEQCRLMEAALAKALRGQTEDFRTAFFEAYKKTAEEMANVGPGPIP